MDNQGLLGAIEQYFSVEPQPRLHRRNSWFRDHQISDVVFLKVGIVAFVLNITIVIFWSLMGVII